MPPSPAAKKRKSEHHIKEPATSLKDDIKGNLLHIFGHTYKEVIFNKTLLVSIHLFMLWH